MREPIHDGDHFVLMTHKFYQWHQALHTSSHYQPMVRPKDWLEHLQDLTVFLRMEAQK